MTDKKELIEAARMLQEYCNQFQTCYKCIFNAGGFDCILDNQPCDYDLPEEGAADE